MVLTINYFFGNVKGFLKILFYIFKIEGQFEGENEDAGGWGNGKREGGESSVPVWGDERWRLRKKEICSGYVVDGTEDAKVFAIPTAHPKAG